MLERRGLHWVRRSAGVPVDPETEVLLGDTMGELPLFYAGADVAFVGGSLVAVGGHNLLEPAALAVPIVTGPHNFNGQEIHDKLAAAGAVSTVHDASDLAAELERLLGESAARREQGERGFGVVAANRGAVGRVLRLVNALDDATTSGQAARVY
jgi:3-deoxy-D-manno-octulosonic-acid transferase